MFYSAKDVKTKEKCLRAVITKWLELLENQSDALASKWFCPDFTARVTAFVGDAF